ncbi:MAG TPA: hypothetical protein VHC47_04630 [Mucilaginibacter sp.]|nr:hypothetical protein [Mucilaginibacter sp.]
MPDSNLNLPFNGLESFLELLKTDTIHSLQANGKMTTGRAAEQITIAGEGNRAQLEIPGYMLLLEKGRGPTSPNALPCNPPMIERIKTWCNAKGIPAEAVWAIKKSIDKKGFKGIPGLLSEPLSEININFRLDPAAEEIADTIVQQLIDSMDL